MRILRDPAAIDAAGGGPIPPPAAPPVPPTPAPTVTAPPPATPPMVPLTVEEYQRLRGAERALAEFQAEQQKAIDAAEAQRLKLLADKEGAERALAEQKTIYEQKVEAERGERMKLQTSYLGEKKTTTIAHALAGRDFVSADAERQVIDLLAPRLESALDASGKVVVREQATGRPAADVIKEALDSAAYAHFLKPTSQGGAGAGGGDKPPPAPETPAIPKTLGERIIAETLAAGGNPMPRSFSPQLFTQTAPGRN